MAATHASGTLQASISLAAGGTQTSGTLDNSTGYGAIITARVTNGATGPTAGCVVTLNVSPDGTTWYQWAQQTAGVAASGVYPLAFRVEPETLKAQIVFNGTSGQAVTVDAQYQQLTGL
ncbi:MAG: hypothetical protein NVSMB20_03260 [Bradyrhizobium sp.]